MKITSHETDHFIKTSNKPMTKVVMIALAALCWVPLSRAADGPVKMLVTMSTTGTVECYDPATGRHEGTVIRGLSRPMGLALGDGKDLFVTQAQTGRPGSVKRYDLETGRFVDDFLPPLKGGAPGAFEQGASLVFHAGDLFVASYHDGRVLRFDGETGAYIDMAAKVEGGALIQFAIRGDVLYVADFKGHAVQRLDLQTGKSIETIPAPRRVFGVALDGRERLFFSPDINEVHRWDGEKSSIIADLSDGAFVANYLSAGPDGNIYISTALDTIVAVSADRNGKDSPARIIKGGAEMRGPAQVVFTNQPVALLPPLGKPTALPASRQVVDVKPTAGAAAKAVFRMEADLESATLPVLSWDTEGGPRAEVNLLHAPVRLTAHPPGGSGEIQAKAALDDAGTLDCVLEGNDEAAVRWQTRIVDGRLQMTFSGKGKALADWDGMELVFPFDPLATATTVIAEDWDDSDTASLPFIINAADFGQLYVTCKEHPDLRAHFEGNRSERWINLTFRLPVPKDGESYTLDFSPLALPVPAGLSDSARWEQNRRAWFGMLQFNARWGYRDESWGNRAGIWANNVISDAVSSVLYMLADHSLLVPELAPGVRVAPMLRRTVDFWLDTKMTPEGEIFYYERRTGSMDANPSTLIGAWAYVEATNDLDWLRNRIGKLELAASYTDGRDLDGDGLVESKQSGNSGTFSFGDTAWDTFSSGHKNAMVNLLTYRAWCGMADLEDRLGRPEKKAYYLRRAAEIQAAFEKTFYNPETGWLGWWRSEDEMLHDLHSDLITGMAVMYGVITPERGREMFDRYWQELEKVGFRRFDLGLPLTIKPVPWQDYHLYKTPEGTTQHWQQYLNGGCCVTNTYFSLIAMSMVGQGKRSDDILNAMLKRQNDGAFPNGGGFQNGIVNRGGEGAEFMDWEGRPCGYEGYLIYSYSFTQALLQREAAFRNLIYRPMLEARKSIIK
jgi:hypothetical protein